VRQRLHILDTKPVYDTGCLEASSMEDMPSINQEKCNQCGLCIEVCKCGAIVIVNKVVTIVETEQCHWCTNCEAVCPTGALSCSFEIIIEE
jgi:MinD superfamily P-loop ATPase